MCADRQTNGLDGLRFLRIFRPLTAILPRNRGIELASSDSPPMILWSLQGHSSDFVCSIEKRRGGYRLLVRQGATTIVDDVLPDVRRARWKADTIRRELLEIGFVATA